MSKPADLQPANTQPLVVEEKKPDVLPDEVVLPLSLDISNLNFSEKYGVIKDATFKSYGNDKLILRNGFFLGNKNWLFSKENVQGENITFIYKDAEKRISKVFIFHKSNYNIELELEVTNLSNTVQSFDLPLILGTLNFSSEPSQSPYLDVVIGQPEKTHHVNGRKNMAFADNKFLAIRNRYFCAIIEPTLNKYTAFVEKVSNNESEVGLRSQQFTLNPNQSWKEKFRIYLGPQDLKQIEKSNPIWTNVIYYGSFDIISQILLSILEFLQRLVHSLGLAIVMLSILIYFLLFPLTVKQMRSMKEMQLLQPRIEELKKDCKDNPQKLNKEIMELYREHKVNPLGGCLPVVLQIPIFFALYQALVRTIALKGAKFLWIKDLSQPDRLFSLPVNLPFLGNAFNILPILMAIGMFVQQKTTATSSAGMSSEQQKMMLILFPVMFGLIFYNMPSGLVLYWFTNSIFTLIYQIRINGTPRTS
ncbi:MAG: membrane protein insertase YidC [Candidatus Omnitrophica bacterium]|nr:membrane protein insertase YidC [Candidatus Omnitrophota bacterium]